MTKGTMPGVPVVSRAALARLRETGVLSASAWETAMDFCGFIPGAREWRAYWRHILLLGGVLFLAAGVIFFIAWNWSGMHPFSRMALVGFLVAVTGAVSAWRGPDTEIGRALLLACGICVGPLLAVFGQTYQTGAELWELFRVWTAVLFALAIVGRQAALWFVTWLSGNVFVMLWLGRSLGSPLEALGMFGLLPECLLALALALTAWEWAADKAKRKGTGQSWLCSRWLPRILFLDLTVRITFYLCRIILSPYRELDFFDIYFLPHGIVIPALALGVAVFSWYWYRKRTPDLFMFACLAVACVALIVTVLVKVEFAFEAEVWALLIWGLVIVGLTVGAANVLLALQRQMGKADDLRMSGLGASSVVAFFAPAKPVPSWELLRNTLQEKEVMEPGGGLPTTLAEDIHPASAWHIRFLVAVGGWIASILFLAFLALFLFLTLGIREDEGLVLFASSWVPLGIAWACFKRQGNFVRHFGFSLALTGSIAASAGLGLAFGGTAVALFFMLNAVLLAGLCVVMRSAAYRFIAALFAVQFVAAGILALALPSLDFWEFPDREGWVMLYTTALYGTAAWWAVLCCALVIFHLAEKDWRGKPWSGILEPVFYGIYGGSVCWLILALAVHTEALNMFISTEAYIPSGSFAVGLGAGTGILCLVWRLMKGENGSTERRLVLGCAVLSLPLGWFLPGVTLASFGLALSRRLGSLVMQGTTAVFLFVYMAYYYYFLGVPLLEKSLLLAGTGMVLLLLAWALRRFEGYPAKVSALREDSHA